MSKDNNKKTPKVRFPGFDKDWEERKLDDVVEFLDTMRKPLEGAKRISGLYPYYGASGIVDYVDGYLFDEELILLSEDGANITDRNYPVCFLASGKYWVNNHAHVLRTKHGNENNFICNSLERKDYTQYNTGMAMPKLNKETCKKIPILCPGFEEQKKIGDYFRNLDNLIALHQRKLEKLKEYKKGMLQKMFPKNGEKIPEVRVPGFTDDWEQRKFSELCDMVTVGIANSATHAYSDSGIVMFRNQNIKPNFLDDNDIIHINPEFEARYKNKRLKKNDLLVARTGYPGTACVVPEKYENSQTFTTLIARPKNSVNPYFLCQYLNSDIGVKYFESTQIGGGQKNSGAGILNEMPIMLPSVVEEESKIADYFNHLDNLITLHQRKLEMLKEFKKGCLQQMFV